MKTRIFTSAILFAAIVSAVPSTTANENRLLTLENFATERTQLFMPGHEGDPSWVEGFQVSGDMYHEGIRVGTMEGRIMMLNPPLIVTAPYVNLSYDFTYDWEGVGTWQAGGTGLALTTSDILTSGNYTTTWMGTLSNGTGHLEGLVGVVSAIHKGNLFGVGLNPSIETSFYRIGY